MPAAFATHQDVEQVWRSDLTAAEQRVVNARLGQASRLIRHTFGTIDQRIADSDIDGELVKDVAVNMVVRYLQNPDGHRQEAIEDYSYTLDNTISTGAVYLTDDEIALLTPANRRTGRAFTIVPGQEPASYAHLDAVRQHQHDWRDPT